MARSKVALIVAGTIVLLVGITSIILIIFFSLKVAEVTTDKHEDSNAEVLYPEFSKLAEGWMGSSGPAFDKNGIFYFTESSRKIDGNYRGRVLKINKSSGIVSVLFAPFRAGYGGGPAGIEFNQNDAMFVTDIRLGLLRLHPNTSYEQVSKVDTDGRALQGCNDLTFDYKGTLWFTGPATAIAPANYTFKPESVGDPIGSIYAMVKFGEIIRIAKNYAYPNGIAVQHTADGRPSKLIIAETGTGNLWSHNIISPGKVASRQLWGKVPEQVGFSGPDGMEFDDEGYLLVAHWGSSHIEVFSPRGGAPVARIKCPFSKPSNLEFRPNSSEVYVTDQTYNALWRFKWRTKGRNKWAFL